MQRREEQIGYLKVRAVKFTQESIPDRSEFFQKRAEVFTELLDKGDIAKVNADTSNNDQLIRLLDTVVIKLEGGSDDDLKVLDEKPVVVPPPQPKVEEKKEIESVEASETEKKPADEDVEQKSESKKRRRTHTDSSSNSSSDSESEAEDGKKKANGAPAENEDEAKNGAEEGAEQKDENADTDMKDEPSENKPDAVEEDEKKIEEVVDLVEEEAPVKKLEELHKTSSVFVRNLAPTITKAEVEALCKRYDGFLRVAIADPAVERRWFRRGWITFKREVIIKEVCWNLNNVRLRDCELAPIVNRDLSRRVRPVNGITAHKTVCKNDIKLCAKIAHSLDEKSGLWKDAVDESEKKLIGYQSKNPVLKNITDYLIDEADAEEEELLGLSRENKDDGEGEFLDRDPELISVLDRIIFYLRIVHSVDFYSKKPRITVEDNRS